MKTLNTIEFLSEQQAISFLFGKYGELKRTVYDSFIKLSIYCIDYDDNKFVKILKSFKTTKNNKLIFKNNCPIECYKLTYISYNRL